MKLLTALFLLLVSCHGVCAEPFPSDDEIRSILRARVDTFKQSVGMVVGLIDEEGTRIIGYGRSHTEGGHAVNGGTIYEIGSISMVFTTLVLADMVRRGEVKLTDPVSRYVPEGVRLPTRGGREITLLDLATHRSGLPRMPDDVVVDLDAATDDYSLDRMYAYLSSCSLIDDIGARYYYSNLGFGLLADVLARRAGQDFEQVLIDRVCGPLGLIDTRFGLTAAQRDRKAGVHDWRHGKTPEMEFGGMKGAGALRSTARDLLRFLAANAGLDDTVLWAPAQLSHLHRRSAGGNVDVGLGWHSHTHGGRRLVVHNGATYGNISFAGFDREGRRGVVVLSNARGVIDDIGVHLLDPTARLARFDEPDVYPPAVDLPIEKLSRLAGEYLLGTHAVTVVSVEDDALYGSYNDGLKFPLRAASDHELFTELGPGVMDFGDFEDNRPQKVTVRYLGHEMTGERIEDYHRAPKRVDVPDESFDRYVGEYALESGLELTVRVRDGALMIQADGQSELSTVRTQAGFYSASAKAEIVFDEDEAGRVVGVVLRQDEEYRGRKLGN